MNPSCHELDGLFAKEYFISRQLIPLLYVLLYKV
jgi:hypothetical protein